MKVFKREKFQNFQTLPFIFSQCITVLAENNYSTTHRLYYSIELSMFNNTLSCGWSAFLIKLLQNVFNGRKEVLGGFN